MAIVLGGSSGAHTPLCTEEALSRWPPFADEETEAQKGGNLCEVTEAPSADAGPSAHAASSARYSAEGHSPAQNLPSCCHTPTVTHTAFLCTEEEPGSLVKKGVGPDQSPPLRPQCRALRKGAHSVLPWFSPEAEISGLCCPIPTPRRPQKQSEGQLWKAGSWFPRRPDRGGVK